MKDKRLTRTAAAWAVTICLIGNSTPLYAAGIAKNLVGTLAFAKCKKDSWVNVRDQASVEGSEIVGILDRFDSAKILNADIEGWYYIKSGELEGYVSSELLATGKKAKKIAKKVAYHYAAVIAEKLNVRETADAEGEVFTSLNEGAEVEIVEDNGDWLKVCLDADTYGYINSSYAVKKTDYPTGQTMAQMEEERARSEAQAQAESERQAQAEAQAQAETEVQENSPEPMEMELEPVLAYAKEEVYTEPQSETQEEYQAENQTEYQRDYQAEDPAEVQEQSETQVEYQEELEPETQAEYSEESQPETQAEYSEESQPETQAEYQEEFQPETQEEYQEESQPETQAEYQEESQPETQEEYQEEFQPETQEEYQQESQLETQTESQTESQPETSAPEILTDEYMAEAADHAEADAAAAAEETAASELPAEEAEKQTVPESSAGQAAADYACQFVGNPYVWGGTSLTEGADCSGFTLAVYAKYGVTLPHYAASQASCGTQISLSQLAPGDLVFFSSDGSKIDHVAIYIGNNSIVHAANTQSGIIISSLEWQNPVSAARVV